MLIIISEIFYSILKIHSKMMSEVTKTKVTESKDVLTADCKAKMMVTITYKDYTFLETTN